MSARENPQGVSGFEFIEFAASQADDLHTLFRQMGFGLKARSADGNRSLYQQGDIRFVINETPDSFASRFAELHGPCCCGFALRVDDPERARDAAAGQGARTMGSADGLSLDLPAIEGIGGSVLYLTGDASDIDAQFEEVMTSEPRVGFGLTFIDHLTHNVVEGNMAQWAEFYEKYFGFFEVKYFDIRGSQTGLRSKAMTSPGGEISIPINESSEENSQINEYIREYNGEGVQHIALYTDSIYDTVEAMREADITFLDTPDTYYEIIDQRIPCHQEDVPRMMKNRILIDAETADQKKQLLQIFTETNIGPIFFEIIQRKGNKGFGEGNFQALFDSIELDQKRRGVL